MRTLIFLVGFFLTSAIFAQSNIRFDETEAENISYARTKCSVVVKLDPDSPNHFYALFSCINQTIHNRYYTKKKKITIADLEELEKKKIILPDGLCIHTSKTRRTEMPYTKGEKNGIFKVYQKEILQSETLYENDKRVQITEYYENGNAKQKILLEGSTLIEQKHYTPDGRDTVFSIKPVEAVHKMPRFPGGEEKMHEYLKANLNYPKTRPTGRVVVTFVVNEDGRISDISVVRNLNPEADAEAVRVIEKMPNWEPGETEAGVIVPVYFSLPIKFALEKRTFENREPNYPPGARNIPGSRRNNDFGF